MLLFRLLWCARRHSNPIETNLNPESRTTPIETNQNAKPSTLIWAAVQLFRFEFLLWRWGVSDQCESGVLPCCCLIGLVYGAGCLVYGVFDGDLKILCLCSVAVSLCCGFSVDRSAFRASVFAVAFRVEGSLPLRLQPLTTEQ